MSSTRAHLASYGKTPERCHALFLVLCLLSIVSSRYPLDRPFFFPLFPPRLSSPPCGAGANWFAPDRPPPDSRPPTQSARFYSPPPPPSGSILAARGRPGSTDSGRRLWSSPNAAWPGHHGSAA